MVLLHPVLYLGAPAPVTKIALSTRPPLRRVGLQLKTLAIRVCYPINKNRNIKLTHPLCLVKYVVLLTSQVEDLEKYVQSLPSSLPPARSAMNAHKMPDSHRPSRRPRSRYRVQFATPIVTAAHTNIVSELTPSINPAPIA